MTAFSKRRGRARTWAAGLAVALGATLSTTLVAAPAGAAPVAAASVSASSVKAAAHTTLGARTLRPHDRGTDVKKLQKLLGVKQTGYFNKTTAKAVRKIERYYGLKPNAIVSLKTLAAIKRYAKAKKASRSSSSVNTPAEAKRYARAYIADKYGWSATQMACLTPMWQRESGWNYRASNPNGKYHGIPQTSSAVWRAAGYSNSQYMGSATVQIKVGTRYIKSRYGTPCKAWSFWKSHHWY